MDVFLGDTIEIDLDTGVVLTGLTVKIKFKRPDDTSGLWTASIHPSLNTHMVYTTLIADLNKAGVWRIQAFALSGLVTRLHGKWVDFEVLDPFSDTPIPPP